MKILSPIYDICETSLTTLATAAVLPMTDEPRFEVNVNSRLPGTASKPTTKPPTEMEPLVYEGVDSFPDEPDDVEERNEADALEERPIQARQGTNHLPRKL